MALDTRIPTPASRGHLARMFGWPRLRVALGFSLVPFVPLSFQWISGPYSLLIRTTALALWALLVFGLLETWPRQLPRWLARWVLQVVGLWIAMPFGTAVIYWWSTRPGAPPFWMDAARLEGFAGLSGIGMFMAGWIALFALVRQKDVLARSQAVALELQSKELARQAAESRLRLLQSQVQPHFLFNTLANVRELVQAQSPQAPAVLDSLIAYLRAAVPRLDDPATTVATELQLVRAYLDLMHMRMPDRLQFSVKADDEALGLRCPPLMLMTLVENAVRHGIDPSEDGGRIDVRVDWHESGRCVASVVDTGLGLRAPGTSLGTGIAALRERLALVFGDAARLRVEPHAPRGVAATVEFPAVGAPPGRDQPR